MLENGAACYKSSSVISKSVCFLALSTRCEDTEHFVVLRTNISPSPRFVSSGLGTEA